MDDIKIEKACAEDVEFIKKLEIESGLGAWTAKDYLDEIIGGNEFFLVAKHDQELIGFILVRLIMINTIPLPKYEAEIYNIAVKREFKNKSIATKLLNRLIEIGKKKNLEKIYLEVRESNYIAQQFYIKNSFKIIGKRRNFYTNPTENAILMCRSLKEEKNHLT